MKHKLYIDGELVYSSRFKIFCDIIFTCYQNNKLYKNKCITMISDYTAED